MLIKAENDSRVGTGRRPQAWGEGTPMAKDAESRMGFESRVAERPSGSGR